MDNKNLIAAIHRSKNNNDYSNYKESPNHDRFNRQKGVNTDMLKSTKLMQAYEETVSKIVVEGLPKDQSIFNHAANSILRWQNGNKDDIALSNSNYKVKNNYYMEQPMYDPYMRSARDGSMSGD